jgi:hypothetical protein
MAAGLAGWEQTRAVLTGVQPYQPTPLAALKPALLPADVRRRTTDHIRLAVEVASEATRALGAAAKLLPSVFASSESDGQITHDICVEVVKDQPQISPTKFHNSVTNAPAGYWCMAIGSNEPSTSVAGYDATFAVALLEALTQLHTGAASVLLVSHDTPMPEPLQSVRPMDGLFGVALVLSREPGAHSVAQIRFDGIGPLVQEIALPDAALDRFRRHNPSARALTLLAAVAERATRALALPYVAGQGLHLHVAPCA